MAKTSKIVLSLLGLMIVAPLVMAAIPRTEYRPYNAGQGLLAACPVDWPIPSLGGGCFVLDGTESGATVTLHDSTFSANLPAKWEIMTINGPGPNPPYTIIAGAYFCDVATLPATAFPQPAGAVIRVWVGTPLIPLSAVDGPAPGSMPPPPCTGAATAGIIQADFV